MNECYLVILCLSSYFIKMTIVGRKAKDKFSTLSVKKEKISDQIWILKQPNGF